MATTTLLQKCESMEWQALFQLYAQFLRDLPEQVDLPARALRNKARAGQLPPEAIPLLMTCLMTAENTTVIAELAKALAAFGRQASSASKLLVDKVRSIVISDDADFWAYDGCLHALGYIGGEHVTPLLQELLDEERTPPVIRSEDLYQGKMPEEDRFHLFYDTLDRVQTMLTTDPGCWTSRRTELDSKESSPSKGLPAWLASVR